MQVIASSSVSIETTSFFSFPDAPEDSDVSRVIVVLRKESICFLSHRKALTLLRRLERLVSAVGRPVSGAPFVQITTAE